MKDETRQLGRMGKFLSQLYLHGNFLSKNMKRRKGRIIHVSLVCPDIIISKGHEIADVIR